MKKKTASAPDTAHHDIADWTILVYMAGDNDLDDFGGDDLQEMKRIGSTDRIHVIVQRDTAAAGVPTKRYRVLKGTDVEQDVVGELGETNTGDPNVLADFLDWGIKTYPAKRTMAVLWNHGAGWDDTDIYAEARRRNLNPTEGRTPSPAGGTRRSGVRGRVILPGGWVHRSAVRRRFRGPFFLTAYKTQMIGGKRRAIAFDDDAQDFLDSVEMKKVFNAAAKKLKSKKFDIIGMDACLMSMIETGLQVAGAGKVYCGSQEIEPGEGWPYDCILKALTAKPDMEAPELASRIAKEFVDSYAKSQPVTQSAFDLAALKNVQQAADELGTALAKAYKKKDFAAQGAINDARMRSQGYEHPDYVDLVDFSQRLAGNLPAFKPLAAKVSKSVTACVIANFATNAKVSGSHGLSIYLPTGAVSPDRKSVV